MDGKKARREELAKELEELKSDAGAAGAPSDPAPPGKSKGVRPRTVRITVLSILAAGAVALGVLTFLAYKGYIRLPPALQVHLDLMADIQAVTGTLSGKDTDASVPAGSYRVLLNQVVHMQEGSRDCELRLENVKRNHMCMRVTLINDTDGAVWYQSHRIDPGKYVKTARLRTTPPAGVYRLTARHELYDVQTHARKGQIDVKLRIYVQKGGEGSA